MLYIDIYRWMEYLYIYIYIYILDTNIQNLYGKNLYEVYRFHFVVHIYMYVCSHK